MKLTKRISLLTTGLASCIVFGIPWLGCLAVGVPCWFVGKGFSLIADRCDRCAIWLWDH